LLCFFYFAILQKNNNIFLFSTEKKRSFLTFSIERKKSLDFFMKIQKKPVRKRFFIKK